MRNLIKPCNAFSLTVVHSFCLALSAADGQDAAVHAEMDKYNGRFARLSEEQKSLNMQLQQVH